MRHQRNYVPYNGDEKITDMVSMTIPNQALSVGEILIRFAQGRPLTASKNFVYGGDVEGLDSIRKMDMTEIDELRISNRQKIKDAKERLKKEESAAAELRKKQAKEKLAADIKDLSPEEPKGNDPKAST